MTEDLQPVYRHMRMFFVRALRSALCLLLMERETGFEPATPSLEGLRSSQLSYSRVLVPIPDGQPHPAIIDPCCMKWWGGEVSNLRRLTPTDLQSVPFGHSGTSPNNNCLYVMGDLML